MSVKCHVENDLSPPTVMCDAHRMTTTTDTSPRVPTWDLADRMRKSLREAGISVQYMADYLDVARGTVSTWINGRITPSRQTIRLWALATGVPFEWLHDGIETVDLEPDGPVTQGGRTSSCNVHLLTPRPALTWDDDLNRDLKAS
jgi:transcriptional regulator with XRE-family HTH domain